MSADNSIAILETRTDESPSRFEYRIIHTQALDNIYAGQDDNGFYRPDREMIASYFSRCNMRYTFEDAWKFAERALNKLVFVEYGIQVVNDWKHLTYKQLIGEDIGN